MDAMTAKPSSAINIVLRAIKARRPIFMWGAPGIGKSDIVASIVRSGALGNAALVDLRLALLEPTDLRGYPFRNPETNQMEWAPPADLPSVELASQYDTVVLFLDELNSAPPSVQAAAYQLVLNRRIGQYVLPDNVVIVAAGNRDNDRGVTYRMPLPLANRFRHIYLRVDFDDWSRWAIRNDVHPDVLGYLSYAKQDLHAMDVKSNAAAFPAPRSWAFVSEMLRVPEFATADLAEQKIEVAGAIGDGVAAKFMEHRRLSGQLPRPEEVLNGSVKELRDVVKNEMSAKYSLAVGLAYELNQLHKKLSQTTTMHADLRPKMNNALRFAFNNFEPEMVVLLLKTIMSEYQIRFNLREDMDTDVQKTFRERYTKYII